MASPTFLNDIYSLVPVLPGSDDFVFFDSLDGNGAYSQMFYAIFQFLHIS